MATDCPGLSERDAAVARTILRKMLRKTVTGGHKKQIDTVKRWGQATEDEGRAAELLHAMATDPAAPVEYYGGGHRENVRLTSIETAKRFLVEELGGEEPFGV
jgi:hypothetical protein